MHHFCRHFHLTSLGCHYATIRAGFAGEDGGGGVGDPSFHVVAVAEGCARWTAPRSCGEGTSGRARPRDRTAPGAREGARAAAGGACAPKKSHSVLFRSKGDTFAFIDTQRTQFSVAALCRRYLVTAAGFYAWLGRQESAHAKQNRVLTKEITRLFAVHHERYGSPRLYQAMITAGWSVRRRRVAHLMRATDY